MEEIKAYRASDGRVFEDRRTCELHETDIEFKRIKGALHRCCALTANAIAELSGVLDKCREGITPSRLDILREKVKAVESSVDSFEPEIFGIVPGTWSKMVGGFVAVKEGRFQRPIGRTDDV